MRCPTCGVDDDRVVDSRPADNGEAVRRRRACGGCGTRYSTVERALVVDLVVRKRSGELRPFLRDKVRDGIDRAANGRVQPADVEEAAAAVERALRSTAADGTTVTSEQVGLQVLTELRGLDPVAYVRFASVYKNFEGPEDFHKELGTLRKDGPPKD